nr:cytochrome p450 [Quercus suber]
MKSTLDSIFKVAFGVELDSMCASSEEYNNFGKAFDDSSALIFWRYVDIFWQMKRFLNIGSEAALKKNIEVVDSFVYKLIHIEVQRMHDSENDSAMKKEDILSRHPSLQDKIAQEVKEATKMSEIDNFAEFAASMNEETLGKMQYLHAAITETIRLYPPLPVDAKLCFSDDTLPDEEFKPERWLDEDGLFRQESPFKFTAFQGGPRICLGKEFAYRQMKIFSTVLLGCHVFKLSDDKKAVDYRTMLNLHIDGGLHVRVFWRHGS